MWETSVLFNEKNMQDAVIMFCHRQKTRH
jgi:hypothetical protein